MADNTRKDPEKTADLPPYGPRNPDPITNTAGSHPIEVGIGAAAGGAATGAAIGMVGGPVGVAVGAIIGAVAGGYAGKGIGELIDPTTEDNWLRDSFADKKYATSGESYEHYEPAYKHAAEYHSKFPDKAYHEVESHVKSGWEATPHAAKMPWDKVAPAVKDAYDRTIQLREERLKVHKDTVKVGEVGVRKEVHTEHKQITVPVEREELVIERHKVTDGRAATGDIRAEEIRIPLKEEKVHVTKESVVKEEVSVGTRKVQGTETVGGEVRREELIVDKDAKAKVREE